MRRALFLFSIVVLSGCMQKGEGIGMKESAMWHRTASMDNKIAFFEQRCKKFGFKPGTDQMAVCIRSEMSESRSSAIETLDGIKPKSFEPAQSNTPPYISVPRPKTCFRSGNLVHCV